mmetsp:Transcript_15829/g.43296  ORF Transcript_15829/g.43296 Transcript_15829/m.43296 type:complete len:323 (+) Transcript_15829:131-1099(+)
MSRELTKYSGRDDRDIPGADVERVMAAQGCSEPVARNLLKYAKLGIGPLAQQAAKDKDPQREMDREWEMTRHLPPRLDRKAAARAAEERLREREEQEEAEERLQELKRKEERGRRSTGVQRLGPVLAREEEVDPLAVIPEAKQMALEKRTLQQAFEMRSVAFANRREDVDSSRPGAASEATFKDSEDGDHVAVQAKQAAHAEKIRAQAEEERRRKAKKKRGRGKSEDSDRERASRHEKMQSASPDTDDEQGRGSLMSEAQVRKMMNKERGTKRERGSVRAQTRIQREMEEWESRKSQNPEFWKAPQFALCYSAETGNKRRSY